MNFPGATRLSAFLTGLSLVAIEVVIQWIAPFGSPLARTLVPLELAYFLATAVVFVVGVKSYTDAPRTRFRLSNYRSHPEAVRFLIGLVTRMFLCFAGAAVGALAVSIYMRYAG